MSELRFLVAQGFKPRSYGRPRLAPPLLSIFLAAFLALSLRTEPANAELLEVTQIANGMECPECSRNLRLAVQRLDGIDQLSTSWNRRVLQVRFRAGSRVELAEIRGIIRQRHFIPGEAQMTCAGILALNHARTELRVSGTSVVYLVPDSIAAPIWTGPLPWGREVVATGIVPAPQDRHATGDTQAASSEDPLIFSLVSLHLRSP